MVKVKTDMAREQALEQENIILRKQLAEQEAKQAEQHDDIGGNLANEMRKIRQKSKASANTITVVEKHDHKNISLWTKEGKRIGPMHPTNAIQTLNRFADLGVALTADHPTEAQIEAYKQTAEYKARQKKWQESRVTADKSRRSGYMEKVLQEISKNSGMTVEALNRILPPEQVGKK